MVVGVLGTCSSFLWICQIFSVVINSWKVDMGAFFFSFLNFWTGFCQNHGPHSVFGWSRRLCEGRVQTPTAGLQVKPHLPWCFLTHWLVVCLVGWWWRWSSQQMSALLLLHFIFTHLLSKGSCHRCAACACYSKLSVLHTPAKMTCSVEFCWPPSDSQICFMSLNFCICNYFVHKTSEWFSFCLFLKKPKRLLNFDLTLLFFYMH